MVSHLFTYHMLKINFSDKYIGTVLYSVQIRSLVERRLLWSLFPCDLAVHGTTASESGLAFTADIMVSAR